MYMHFKQIVLHVLKQNLRKLQTFLYIKKGFKKKVPILC